MFKKKSSYFAQDVLISLNNYSEKKKQLKVLSNLFRSNFKSNFILGQLLHLLSDTKIKFYGWDNFNKK